MKKMGTIIVLILFTLTACTGNITPKDEEDTLASTVNTETPKNSETNNDEKLQENTAFKDIKTSDIQRCFVHDTNDIEQYQLEGIDLEKKKQADEELNELFTRANNYSLDEKIKYYESIQDDIIFGEYLKGFRYGPYDYQIQFEGNREPLIKYQFYKLRLLLNKAQLNVCKNYNVVYGAESNIFPKAKNIDIDYETKIAYPDTGNVSEILFGNNLNQDYISSSQSEYTLTGSVMTHIGEMEVIWNGDMKSNFLNNFDRNSSEFSYEISEENGNLKAGENVYLVRGYANGYVYERAFIYNYYPDVLLELEEYRGAEELSWEDFIGKYSVTEEGEDFAEYKLGVNFGKNSFTLPSGYTLLLEYNPDRNIYGGDSVSILDQNGELLGALENKIGLCYTLCYISGILPYITETDDEVIISSKSGLYSSGTLIFIKSEKKFFSLSDFAFAKNPNFQVVKSFENIGVGKYRIIGATSIHNEKNEEYDVVIDVLNDTIEDFQ